MYQVKREGKIVVAGLYSDIDEALKRAKGLSKSSKTKNEGLIIEVYDDIRREIIYTNNKNNPRSRG